MHLIINFLRVNFLLINKTKSMKKLTFTILVTLFAGFSMFAQDVEKYTALKVTGGNIPVIDGTIEPIWSSVTMVPLTKVPEIGGEVHPNITVPNPEPSDYSAEFGMMWNTDGIFFLFRVVDDNLVIVDDYYTDNDIPADMWWTDDNINILFSKDLVNNTFTQFEFAWQPGVNQEEKLSSDDWANPALIDISMVQSHWYQDGTTWTLETFIKWQSFADGSATITPGMKIYLEGRARDDDDDGTWETMFQWSTVNYNIESDGIGMGEVTLSETEIQAPSGIEDEIMESGKPALYPNPSIANTELKLNLSKQGDVAVTVFDMAGKRIQDFNFTDRNAGQNAIPLNMEKLQQGVYILNVQADNNTTRLKFIKK